jgi:hypothetical protein
MEVGFVPSEGMWDQADESSSPPRFQPILVRPAVVIELMEEIKETKAINTLTVVEKWKWKKQQQQQQQQLAVCSVLSISVSTSPTSNTSRLEFEQPPADAPSDDVRSLVSI